VRKLIYIGDRKIAWREAPAPSLQEGSDAIVRPVAATMCDVDKMITAGKSPVPPPFAIGHECVAEVIDVADGVTHVQPGDLVVGLFSDLVHVPWADTMLVPLPPGLDPIAMASASDRLYVDRDPRRRALAEHYGARTAERIEPIHQGFDVAVEATGRVEELATACCSLVPEGVCESAGTTSSPASCRSFRCT
jgi:threonine dehydrogenase-like Zn-dependent dehydrogenase